MPDDAADVCSGQLVGVFFQQPHSASVNSTAANGASNAEWQAAWAGTPGPGPGNGITDCNTKSAHTAVHTGSRSSCVLARGAFDMVGNLFEWVAVWVRLSTGRGTWSAGVSPTAKKRSIVSGTGSRRTRDAGAHARATRKHTPNGTDHALRVAALSAPRVSI